MATLIETIGIFEELFDFFLPFLLIFTVTYALLMKTKFLSESANINGAIAFALAFIFALSGGGPFLMRLMPFLSMFFIVLFMIIMIFMFFKADVTKVLQEPGVVLLLIGIVVIFVFYVIGEMYGAQIAVGGIGTAGANATVNQTTMVASAESCDFTQTLGPNALPCLIGHPKILGTSIVLGLLAVGTFLVIHVPGKFR